MRFKMFRISVRMALAAPLDLAASDLTRDPMTKLRVTLNVVKD